MNLEDTDFADLDIDTRLALRDAVEDAEAGSEMAMIILELWQHEMIRFRDYCFWNGANIELSDKGREIAENISPEGDIGTIIDYMNDTTDFDCEDPYNPQCDCEECRATEGYTEDVLYDDYEDYFESDNEYGAWEE